MPKVTLALGPIVFRDFELPPEISFGGSQRLAIHRLADGRRVIDCLGREDADIVFSGIFAGPDATSRAQTLDVLRSSGVPLPLTWDTFFYSVLVSNFTAQYSNQAWVPYKLKCTVLRDEAVDLVMAFVSTSESLVDDMNAAGSIVTIPGVDFNALAALVSAPDATTCGTDTYQVAQNGLASSLATLSTQRQNVEQALSTVDLSTASADTALADLPAGTLAAQQLAGLAQAQGFVGRALVNLKSQGVQT